MQQIILFLILSGIITWSCTTSKPTSTSSGSNPLPDSIQLTVQCLNLSENLTGNDEILVLTYLYKDSAVLDQPLFQRRIGISQNNMTGKFKWRITQDMSDKDLIIWLIEQDEEKPVAQIDSVCRIYHQELTKLFRIKNYAAIEKYLGDEDILGISVIRKLDYSKPYEFYFSGMYKLDKYEYLVSVEANMLKIGPQHRKKSKNK